MEQVAIEKEFSTRLFGKEKTIDLKHAIAPMSLILFCYRVDVGFVGDDLGMFARACNDFFPTPTDQGMCLTKNMDIK